MKINSINNTPHHSPEYEITQAGTQRVGDTLLPEFPRTEAVANSRASKGVTYLEKNNHSRISAKHLARFTEAKTSTFPTQTISHPIQGTAQQIADTIGKPPKLVLLLDYDGTLMENTDPYKSTANDLLKATIQDLTRRAEVILVIVSGRDHHYHFKAIPEGLGVHRIANHGADFLKYGHTQWETLVSQGSLDWKMIAKDEMMLFTSQNPGTEIEMKTRGITLHCEKVDSLAEVEIRADDLAKKLRAKLHSYDLKVEHSAKVVEIREDNVDKGKASITVINKLLGDNPPEGTVIVAAGDADTDEGMFKDFAGDPSAVTIRVGPGESCARWRVSNPEQMRDLLTLLALKFEIPE